MVMSHRKVFKVSASLPMVEVCHCTFRKGLAAFKQLSHGFEHWDAHYGEEAQLQQTGTLQNTDAVAVLHLAVDIFHPA